MTSLPHASGCVSHQITASGAAFKPGSHHCVVFLSKTLYSHCAFLHPGVLRTCKFNVGGNPAIDWHPICLITTSNLVWHRIIRVYTGFSTR